MYLFAMFKGGAFMKGFMEGQHHCEASITLFGLQRISLLFLKNFPVSWRLKFEYVYLKGLHHALMILAYSCTILSAYIA